MMKDTKGAEKSVYIRKLLLERMVMVMNEWDVYVQKKVSVLHLTETGSGQEAPDSWRRALGQTGGQVDSPQRTGRVSKCL